ncbi:DinB family protein [Gracilibacillus kekensis]|uniref:DinB superfamily protein n=1 Tax=Gracilibacillus kekensis TaxID=1027249 RepID=A0A1M7IXG3_9BACI|nr:DinB family protein [Gracilibacillus kekensis]SHM44967.1 DinB superfamily protein [Gracilibacillus kekensis]
MIYDLKGEATMQPIVGMLYSAVKENYERLQLITKDMSQQEMDYQGPKDNYNSTAQLINHILCVDIHWVYRIKDEPLPVSLKAQYEPMLDANNRLPMVKDKSWGTLVSECQSLLVMFNHICLTLTDAGLDKVVQFGFNNEKQATIRWGIWHMADHNRYHQAHINQLRKWYKE